jgi:hypothetical protein
MTDEIRIEDLTAGHVRRYDRINADGVRAWEKPSKLAVIVAPDFSSSISTFETLNVRIDSMRKEQVQELHDKAERLFKESSVRK